MAAFDPNAKKDCGLWATYVPNRAPKFKIHQTRGQATAAIKCRTVSSWDGRGTVHTLYPDLKLYQRSSATELWQEVLLRQTFRDQESVIAPTKEQA